MVRECIEIDSSPVTVAAPRPVVDADPEVIEISEDEDDSSVSRYPIKRNATELSDEDLSLSISLDYGLPQKKPRYTDDLESNSDVELVEHASSHSIATRELDDAPSPASTVSLSLDIVKDDNLLEQLSSEDEELLPLRRFPTLPDPSPALEDTDTLRTSFIQTSQQECQQILKEKRANEKAAKQKAKAEAQATKERMKELSFINRKLTCRHHRLNEIAVEISPNLFTSEVGSEVKAKLQEFDSDISPIPSYYSELLGCVRFQRRVTCKFDHNENMFVPVSPYLEYEKTICIVVQATDVMEYFVSPAITREHVDEIKALFPATRILYIVQGIPAAIRKLESLKNKRMRERVRQMLSEATGNSTADDDGHLTSLNLVTPEKIQEGLMALQFLYKFRVVQTISAKETAEWIAGFAMDVAAEFYNIDKHIDEPTNIDMLEPSRSSAVPEEVVKLSLANLKYVTPTPAGQVAAAYPSMGKLFNSLDSSGPDALLTLRTHAGKAVVGASIAKSIHTFMTSTDPSQIL